MDEMTEEHKASLTVVAMPTDCPTCAAEAEKAGIVVGNGEIAATMEAAVGLEAGAAGAAGVDGQGPWRPKILAFCCYFCAYSAADLAGSMRLQYSPDMRVIEMPCSGKTDIALILEAFEKGADGVYVAGCLEGDCHFLKGNIRAKKRVNGLKKLLDQVGVGGERVEFFNVAGSQGPRFAQIADEMTERILKLGPSPVKKAQRAAYAAAAGGPTAQTNSEVGAK